MIKVIYWTGTGNTGSMAKYIVEGIKKQDKLVELKQVKEAILKDVEEAEILVLGCPSMGDEVLEEDEMDPFVESLEGKVTGKKVALFGSYGWGNGQWMEDWEARMRAYGAEIIENPLIINDFSSGDEASCIDFGSKIAK